MSDHISFRNMPAKQTQQSVREQNVISFLREVTLVAKCSGSDCDFSRIHRGNFQSLSDVLEDVYSHNCRWKKHVTISFVVD